MLHLTRNGKNITARSRHADNLMAQGWQPVQANTPTPKDPPADVLPEVTPAPVAPDPEPAADPEEEPEPEHPPFNHSRAKWRDYAISQDVNPEGLTRQQIQEALGLR